MKRYVLGFLFNKEATKLVLVVKNNKNCIEEHRHRLNGVGGKVHSNEIDREETAIRRECSEETGIWVQDWKLFSVMSGSDWTSHNFVAFDDNMINCRQMEDEIIKILDVKDVFNHDVIDNLRWLIPMSLDSTITIPIKIKY